MASIRKRGDSYTIIVSCGYDSKGKKISEAATFTPDPKWSEERARKAAEKFAVRFEDKIKAGGSSIGDKITFEKFSNIFFTDITHLFKLCISSGVIAVSMRIDNHHRLVCYRAHRLFQISKTISCIDQRRLFTSDKQITEYIFRTSDPVIPILFFHLIIHSNPSRTRLYYCL